MKITESSNKRFCNCFMAVTLFKNCFTWSNKDIKVLVSFKAIFSWLTKNRRGT